MNTEQDEDIQLIINNPHSEGSSTATISNFIAIKTILNDDHTPEISKNQIFKLDENTKTGSNIGKVEAIDKDDQNSLQNWQITECSKDNAFSINSSTGELIVNNSDILDKEKIDKITLYIKVSDGANYSKPEEIAIELNDINDVIPVILPTQIFEIKEGITKGYIISSIIFTDADITPAEEYTWNIVKNFDSNNNGIPAIDIDNNNGTITVNDAEEFDYETNKSITFSLTVNDGINTSTEESVTINITDVPEPNENSLVAIYPNPVRTFTIINSKEEGKLFIYNDSGKLTINKILLKGENIIYLTSLSPGVYHFLIKLKSKTIEKTIIIG